jgi:hypothetical protein
VLVPAHLKLLKMAMFLLWWYPFKIQKEKGRAAGLPARFERNIFILEMVTQRFYFLSTLPLEFRCDLHFTILWGILGIYIVQH